MRLHILQFRQAVKRLEHFNPLLDRTDSIEDEVDCADELALQVLHLGLEFVVVAMPLGDRDVQDLVVQRPDLVEVSLEGLLDLVDVPYDLEPAGATEVR
jgi:hypothetical protein